MSDPGRPTRSRGGPPGAERGRGPGRPVRLDALVVALGLAETRAKAQALILAGRILLDGKPAVKAGSPVRPDRSVALLPAPRPYASRGGEKLEGALDDLGISAEGVTVLDVGASTGGFTDCLLRRGARRVYAVDVGKGLLDDSLRRDPRVVVREGHNFRFAPPDLLPEKVGLATVDVSFISLRHILPPLRAFLLDGAQVVALVKPQFEAGREAVGKGGVVRDETKRRGAVTSVLAAAAGLGFIPAGEAECRLRGPRGNREVFVRLLWPGRERGEGTAGPLPVPAEPGGPQESTHGASRGECKVGPGYRR